MKTISAYYELRILNNNFLSSQWVIVVYWDPNCTMLAKACNIEQKSHNILVCDYFRKEREKLIPEYYFNILMQVKLTVKQLLVLLFVLMLLCSGCCLFYGYLVLYGYAKWRILILASDFPF